MKSNKRLNDFSFLAIEFSYFLLVYEQKSINSAARKINQSPGNISRQLARLEKIVGYKLFVRHQTGLRVTEQGERLYAAITQAKDSFAKQMHNQRSHNQKIRIGFSPTIGHAHFSKSFLPALMNLEYTPEFTINSSLILIEMIKKRELDFVMVPQALKLPGLISKVVDVENLVLASSSEDIQKTLVTSSEMLGLERILQGISYEQRWILNDYFVLAKFLEQSPQIMGLLPESICSSYPLLKKLVTFPKEGKITALTWPSSTGAQLLRAAK